MMAEVVRGVDYKILIMICLLIIGCGVFYFYQFNNSQETPNKLYQGPVPEGYDENYFRHTGITKPLENG